MLSAETSIPLCMEDPFDSISHDPMQAFQEWFALAEESEANDPNAAALATATPSGTPSVRMVLIKSADARGLRFFTNSESQKGSELKQNPVAALCFHWKSLRKQVRFEGSVHALGRDEVEAYFHSRSRASQIAAAVSAQSQVLDSRETLLDATRAYTASLGTDPVPLPENWAGYLLKPRRIEFWMDGPDRLHDRLQVNLAGDQWLARRLYP